MNKPTEYKTVQSRILKCAQEIGRTCIGQAEVEKRWGFNSDEVGNGLKPFPTSSTAFRKPLAGIKVS